MLPEIKSMLCYVIHTLNILLTFQAVSEKSARNPIFGRTLYVSILNSCRLIEP